MDLYFECASGISGDMTVAALLDLGADVEKLNSVLASVPLDGFRTEITRVKKAGIDCCDFNVILDEENHDHDMEWLFGHEHHNASHSHDGEHYHEEHTHSHGGEHHHGHHHAHRGMNEIVQIINDTSMTENARKLALKVFDIIAESESKSHGIPKEQVHFHEVGAVDSIVDVIAFAVCFDDLNPSRVYIPKIFEGSGTIRCQHGILPVSVPAVMNIASEYGLILSLSEEKGEFITPTGAAFAAAICTDQKFPGGCRIVKSGYGAGKRNYERPSILRVIQVESEETFSETDEIIKIETNIDDCTGENLGFALDELFANGARDVYYVPCYMKKNRPAFMLNVICDEKHLDVMQKIIFRQTTTIGVRFQKMHRSILERELVELETSFGKIKAKCVRIEGKKRFYPEYECVAEIARRENLSY